MKILLYLAATLVPFWSEAVPVVNDSQWYPKYHLAASAGWINDPNGLSFYDGYYHAFYQYNPYDVVWGPMHWGHARSKDMLNWEHLPVALAPSLPDDKDGIYSGSAVNNNGVLTLMYTGVSLRNNSTHQAQCLATSSDGISFKKEGVVLRKLGDDTDFRDPKLWRQDDSWYVVIGARNNSQGQALLYSSPDLHKWEFQTILAASNGTLGYMWECPDFFTLGGKQILVINPQGIKQDGYNYQNLYQTGYFVGSWTPGAEYKIEKEFREIDKGYDFYASQTFLAPDGRRILIAWMDMWEDEFPESATGWAGMMTLPRELSLSKSGDLQVKPISEVRALRSKLSVRKEHFTVSSGRYLSIEKNVTAKEVFIVFGMNNTKADKFGFQFGARSDNSKGVSIYVDRSAGRLFLQRNYPNYNIATGSRSVSINPDKDLSLNIFFDRSSIEIFVNLHESVMSSRIYPSKRQRNLSLFAENGAAYIRKYRSWDL